MFLGFLISFTVMCLLTTWAFIKYSNEEGQ